MSSPPGPTADHVAIALVAACRETGEDPVATADGSLTTSKARHYAMHALVHVFRDVLRSEAARMVGCPGKPVWFWNNSQHGVIGRGTDGKRRAKWFDDSVYDRVIRAIENEMAEDHRDAAIAKQRLALVQAPNCPMPSDSSKTQHPDQASGEGSGAGGSPMPPRPAQKPASPPYKPCPLPVVSYRPPEGAVAKILESRPVFDRGTFGAAAPARDRAKADSKSELKQMLADAARRTAELPTDSE